MADTMKLSPKGLLRALEAQQRRNLRGPVRYTKIKAKTRQRSAGKR